ncbi:hypothetical protein [Streptomyces sp. NPDC004065]|uniref:hypothetical protein n=1 Tax=Streptomyces sp. NPDC004065 TaxID=3364689 RepID=UPI00384D22CE
MYGAHGRRRARTENGEALVDLAVPVVPLRSPAPLSARLAPARLSVPDLRR